MSSEGEILIPTRWLSNDFISVNNNCSRKNLMVPLVLTPCGELTGEIVKVKNIIIYNFFFLCLIYEVLIILFDRCFFSGGNILTVSH